jgi:cation/acetate symporter
VIYEPSYVAVLIFGIFVAITLGLSFYLGRRTKGSQGYFAAHGQIPWFVNGVAFAGDYLSAASFLGICGMIAFYGYDGFLYSIGYLAGWVVALFVIAEPMKRLGKFTFADALDAQFDSRGIKLVAGISTLAVSIFYLIPQMVGAGVLIQPLLGFPHWAGVVIVGAVVIVIVVTAGMVSTTYVQFLKGALLVVFSAILVVLLLVRGFTVRDGGTDGYRFARLGPFTPSQWEDPAAAVAPWSQAPEAAGWRDTDFLRLQNPAGTVQVFSIHQHDDQQIELLEAQTLTEWDDGTIWVNGQPQGDEKGEPELHPVDLESVLTNEIEKARSAYDETTITVTGDPHDELEVVATDSGSLSDIKGWAESTADAELLDQQETTEGGEDVYKHYIKKVE